MQVCGIVKRQIRARRVGHVAGVARSISDGGTSPVGEAVVERGRNLIGIRAKLLNFLIRRPTQEDLIKQGIIKGTGIIRTTNASVGVCLLLGFLNDRFVF